MDVYRYKMINLSAVTGSYPKPYTNVLEKPCTQLPETLYSTSGNPCTQLPETILHNTVLVLYLLLLPAYIYKLNNSTKTINL